MLLCQLALPGRSLKLHIFELGRSYIEITRIAVGLFLIKDFYEGKSQEPIFVNVKIRMRCVINVKRNKEASGSRKRRERHVINLDWDSHFVAFGVYRS
jgi:hypothetical protein